MSQEIETRISQCNQNYELYLKNKMKTESRCKIKNELRLVFMNGKIEIIVYLIEY